MAEKRQKTSELSDENLDQMSGGYGTNQQQQLQQWEKTLMEQEKTLMEQIKKTQIEKIEKKQRIEKLKQLGMFPPP